MLHTLNPVAYLPENKLHEVGNCPNCQTATALGKGVIVLAHYMSHGKAAQGLLWLCSQECYLSWEHKDYLHKA
mgnify:CR=1 FL=1